MLAKPPFGHTVTQELVKLSKKKYIPSYRWQLEQFEAEKVH